MDGDQEILDAWHRDELTRLGFNSRQRQVLMEAIDKGEVTLVEIRDLIEKRQWTPDQAFLSAA